MTQLDRQQVESALTGFIEPHLGRDLVAAGCVEGVDIDGSTVRVALRLGFPARRLAPSLREAVRETLAVLPGVAAVEVTIRSVIEPREPDPDDVTAVPGVRNIIAVSSGKGGVGKSTTSVNLALALADEGARVGVLDADIYGPSLPRMLGISGRPRSYDGKRFQPLMNYGLQVMSAGFLVDEEEPMIWRGSMVTQALEQLMRDTEWKDLDYLVVDMPPGTGDIQLTLAQRIKVAGAVIVTTPQDIALLDATRGLKMFEKVGVPVLGVIENMGLHCCSQCGHEEHVFGDGGGARMADKYGLDFLGALPLDIRIREQADNGMPTVVADPDGSLAESYRRIARAVAARLSLRQVATPAAFPKITIAET
ncbi:iron-sulfur cluster carrier protein ApbC [Azoarcus taiwanensis]|uniref:Iron-sulfur cluster carrier protein n=1 Tax=Azoarcus taiwanensis TaxID=666964 RepID=A0A972FD01_9RHOO|nr:iron-sulfur cluster carrier protein ApbC [Azoarcus taiwanensis]NMG02385.1 iron-sulfur cluster carrier protein ApbC [Azoarcus taiwanensis]